MRDAPFMCSFLHQHGNQVDVAVGDGMDNVDENDIKVAAAELAALFAQGGGFLQTLKIFADQLHIAAAVARLRVAGHKHCVTEGLDISRVVWCAGKGDVLQHVHRRANRADAFVHPESRATHRRLSGPRWNAS